MFKRSVDPPAYPDPVSEKAFDPASLEFIAGSYPTYADLREHHPVWYDEQTDRYVARYADVDALLRDRRLGRS